jgi:hypothetical protein
LYYSHGVRILIDWNYMLNGKQSSLLLTTFSWGATQHFII